jgi:hypothetical protein
MNDKAAVRGFINGNTELTQNTQRSQAIFAAQIVGQAARTIG